jgi:hypothetical protein
MGVAAAVLAILPGLLAVSWPPGLPGVQVIKVSLEDESNGGNKTCSATFDDDRKVMEESDDDILVLRIHNKCSMASTVKINYKMTNGVPPSKPTCLGQPYKAKLGEDIPLAKDEKAYVICTVAYDSANSAEEKFGLALTWTSVAPGPGEVGIKASEIALEDVPLR